MDKNIDLSVVIPCYNNSHSIIETLDSVYKQKDLSYEIIIVDDMSTDNTIEIVKDWAKQNVPIRIIKNTRKEYSLLSRIKGFNIARSENIMTIDADDKLRGTNLLAKAVNEKKRQNVEILHFRSVGISEISGQLGEFTWLSPFYDNKNPNIKNERIFDIYSSLSYPPVTLWGKIFSKSLIEKVIPIAEKNTLLRFDVKLLTSLLMLYASSYFAYDEYIYEYKNREEANWTIDIRLKGIQALLIIERVLKECMLEKNVTQNVQIKFISFIKRRIVLQLGYLSITACDGFKNSELNSNNFCEAYSKYIDENTFFSLIFYATHCNVLNLRNKREIACAYTEEKKQAPVSLIDSLFTLLENYQKLQEKFKIQYIEKLCVAFESICNHFTSSSHIDIINNNEENISLLLMYASKKDYIFILIIVNSYIANTMRKLRKHEIII